MNSFKLDKFVYTFLANYPKGQWETVLTSLLHISIHNLSRRYPQLPSVLTLKEIAQFGVKGDPVLDQLQILQTQISKMDRHLKKAIKRKDHHEKDSRSTSVSHHRKHRHQKTEPINVKPSQENYTPEISIEMLPSKDHHAKSTRKSETLSQSMNRSHPAKGTLNRPKSTARNKGIFGRAESVAVLPGGDITKLLQDKPSQNPKAIMEIPIDYLNNSTIKNCLSGPPVPFPHKIAEDGQNAPPAGLLATRYDFTEINAQKPIPTNALPCFSGLGSARLLSISNSGLVSDNEHSAPILKTRRKSQARPTHI